MGVGFICAAGAPHPHDGSPTAQPAEVAGINDPKYDGRPKVPTPQERSRLRKHEVLTGCHDAPFITKCSPWYNLHHEDSKICTCSRPTRSFACRLSDAGIGPTVACSESRSQAASARGRSCRASQPGPAYT